MKVWRPLLANSLSWWLVCAPLVATAQEPVRPALLQLRVVEGEGGVHTAGGRASRPIVIFVSDESGRPVTDAAVSIRLPDDGPSGLFLSGLRTEVLLTGPDGLVSVRGIQWNQQPGPISLRITASKGDARAGLISTQSLTAPSVAGRQKDGGSRPSSTVEPASRGKWLLLTALIGGAAAGGVAAVARGAGSAPRAGTAPVPPAASSQPTVSIGTPSITIGKP